MSELEPILAQGLAGRYVLEAEVGRGGMATVYRARDLRHDRTVAIKVLRPDLRATIDPARFLREIAITSRLQHPNILPLFDSGEVAGVLYYVMPFVAGETLAHRLAVRGRLEDQETLTLTREICDALAYAHRQGVVHRDLKPGNILLSEGHALLGDFGIAHAAEGDRTRITQGSHILGTPAYMSPEQARGADTDHRADLYALGILVYEMFSGALPYNGPTPQAMLALRLVEPPEPLRHLRPDLPAAVVAAVERALEREPEARFDSATEFAAALGDAQPVGTWRSRWYLRLVAPVLLAAGLLAGGAWWANRGAPAAAPPLRHRQVTSRGDVRQVSLSGDARWLAYTATVGDSMDVVIRDLTTGTELVRHRVGSVLLLRWSADGTQLFLSTPSGALLLPRDSGPATRLPATGRRLLGPDEHTQLGWSDFSNALRVQGTGDTGSSTVRFDGLTHIEHATFGPTAGFVAVAGDSGSERNTQLWIGALDRPLRHFVARAPGRILDLAWGASAGISYLALNGSATELWHQRVRPDGHPTGTPVLLASGLPVVSGPKYTQGLLSVTGRGQAALVRTLIETQIRRLHRQGWDSTLTSGTALRGAPAYDPTGRRLAYLSDEGEARMLVIAGTDGGPASRVPGAFQAFAWHPDGGLIALTGGEPTPRLLVLDLASGSITPVAGATPGGMADVAWAADSALVYVTRQNRGLAATSLRTGATRQLIPDSAGWVFNPEPSPDGRQVAFLWGGAATPRRVYLADLAAGTVRGVGPLGNWRPVGWSADGRSVFVMSWREAGERQIYRLDLAEGQLTPHLLLPVPAWPWNVQVRDDGEEVVLVDFRRQGDAWILDGLPSVDD